MLARTGGAALDVAGERNAVIAAVDQLALQLRLLRPVEFLEAAVERDLIVAAVAGGLDRRRDHARKRIRHIGFADEIAPADLDAVEPEILRHHVDQALAEEIGLEATRPAIGA